MNGDKTRKPLFTPRSSGLGWTLNPEHPVSWVVMTGVIAVIIYSAFR